MDLEDPFSPLIGRLPPREKTWLPLGLMTHMEWNLTYSCHTILLPRQAISKAMHSGSRALFMGRPTWQISLLLKTNNFIIPNPSLNPPLPIESLLRLKPGIA